MVGQCTPFKYMVNGSIPVIIGIVLSFMNAIVIFAVIAYIEIKEKKNMIAENNVAG